MHRTTYFRMRLRYFNCSDIDASIVGIHTWHFDLARSPS